MIRKNDPRETIGYCQGLCGGLHSHHLVDGLCETCRQDSRISTIDAREADDDDMAWGVEAATLTPEMKAYVAA